LTDHLTILITEEEDPVLTDLLEELHILTNPGEYVTFVTFVPHDNSIRPFIYLLNHHEVDIATGEIVP